MMAQDMVETLGHEIVRTATTPADALVAIDSTPFDVALLDVNLNGESSLPVAARLTEAGRPFAFTTGYGSQGADSDFADVPVLTKPYSLSDLEAQLNRFADQCAATISTTSTTDSNAG